MITEKKNIKIIQIDKQRQQNIIGHQNINLIITSTIK